VSEDRNRIDRLQRWTAAVQALTLVVLIATIVLMAVVL
jgi:hypothetical protein